MDSLNSTASKDDPPKTVVASDTGILSIKKALTSQSSALEYDRDVKRISFPAYDQTDPVQFYDQISDEVEYARGLGISEEDIASTLIVHIKKTSLRRRFKTVLGKDYSPSAKEAIEAFRICLLGRKYFDAFAHFKNLKPKNKESYRD